MKLHSTVEPLSTAWFIATGICFGSMIVLLILPVLLGKKSKIPTAKFMGYLLLSISILVHPYLLYIDRWAWNTALPLHLCTMSGYICAFALITQNQRAFEFAAYWGVSGGIHSILTPELLHGIDPLLYIEYYVLHGGIFFAAIFLSVHLKMRVRKNSWLQVFLLSQLLLPFIFLVNWILGSNYMYMNEKPKVDSPFLIGEWPVYILFIELFMLIHFFIVFLIFRNWKKEPALQTG